MAKRPSQIKAKTTIAPETTLPGLSGAVGIDVSKAKFNACYMADNQSRGQHGEFTSDAAGHAKFLVWLNRVGAGRALHLCMEETGCYGQALAAFLHEAGHLTSALSTPR